MKALQVVDRLALYSKTLSTKSTSGMSRLQRRMFRRLKIPIARRMYTPNFIDETLREKRTKKQSHSRALALCRNVEKKLKKPKVAAAVVAVAAVVATRVVVVVVAGVPIVPLDGPSILIPPDKFAMAVIVAIFQAMFVPSYAALALILCVASMKKVELMRISFKSSTSARMAS
jgi:hypothetical protein